MTKGMVYIVIAVAGFLIIGAIVAGCSIKPADNKTCGIKGISISQSHMNFGYCYSFYLREDDGKVIFDAEVRFEEEPYQVILESCEVDSSYMRRLEEIDKTHNISACVNGYKKKPLPFQIMDKTVKTTTVYFKDGTDKSADTNSAYEQELYSFFEEIALKYRKLSANVS